MRIFLLWHGIGGQAPPGETGRVSLQLRRLFEPLASTPFRVEVREKPSAALVFLDLPVHGWKPAFFQEDDKTWALAPDYPIDAGSVLSARREFVPDNGLLPALGRAFEADPAPLLREMAPPFGLIWSTKSDPAVFVQNDGLGQSQLFEFQDRQVWALSNRLFAFRALGALLEPLSEEWAVRVTLEWFPLQMTGFKGVRFLEPGTQLRLDAGGIHRRRYDVIRDWLHPEAPLTRDACLELARSSLMRQIKTAMPLWERPSAGLTGGRDSRAVVSALRAAGADFTLRVKGVPEQADVIIARELARVSGLDIMVKSSGGLPAADCANCRRSIGLALLWQAGCMETEEHKLFLSEGAWLDGGVVSVMGQHGEIGRSFWLKMIEAKDRDGGCYGEAIVTRLTKRLTPFLRKRHRELVHHIIRQAYRQADAYCLDGLAQMDFFYLYERTRRWVSGSLSSQTGIVFAPFLNPDYIRAAFAYPGGRKDTSPFHNFIIATLAPEWAGVPYDKDMKEAGRVVETVSSKTNGEQHGSVPLDWRRPTGRKLFDPPAYWEAVGRPLICEALTQGGFWTEVLDPDAVAKNWQGIPDELTMLFLLSETLR